MPLIDAARQSIGIADANRLAKRAANDNHLFNRLPLSSRLSRYNHRSVRDVLPDPVPPGTLETLIAGAQSAAASSNKQLWSAIAVSDPAKRKVLAEIAGNQKHIEQCALYLSLRGRHVAQRAAVAGRAHHLRKPALSRDLMVPVSMQRWPPRTLWSPPVPRTAHRLYRRHAQRPGESGMSSSGCCRRPSSCSGCALAAPIRNRKRGQAAPAAIDGIASRALRRCTRGPEPPHL
ncbi:MAG: nitroreductase family protein [Reyranella sp.]|nr:nitroreductase family protein [Reyranella sp.]